ncbi:hypothetical protein SNARM312S_01885 [Streptomyces narbonensis]
MRSIPRDPGSAKVARAKSAESLNRPRRAGHFAQPHPPRPEDSAMRTTPHSRGLQPNVLGTFDTIVMAVAGSAPAYSLAATTAVLFGAVGFAGPAALLYCAIPMLGIVLAYARLGRIDVNAGAGYSWVGRTLHPFLGFLSGWALVASPPPSSWWPARCPQAPSRSP